MMTKRQLGRSLDDCLLSCISIAEYFLRSPKPVDADEKRNAPVAEQPSQQTEQPEQPEENEAHTDDVDAGQNWWE